MADSRLQDSLKRRHEVSDASSKNLLYFAAGLTVVVAVTCALLWYQYAVVMGVSPAATDTDASAWSRASRELVGVAHEQGELKSEEAKNLETYSWIDRDAGAARIPIDRAMRIVAERGLPEWGEPNPQIQPIDLIRENAESP